MLGAGVALEVDDRAVAVAGQVEVADAHDVGRRAVDDLPRVHARLGGGGGQERDGAGEEGGEGTRLHGG